MPLIRKIKVANGIFWLAIPEAGLRILCGCPADVVKHLMRRGLIVDVEKNGVAFESGPNAILMSEMMIQGGDFANLAEFPVLQMFYRQGMILPGHPNNTGARPLLIGTPDVITAQLAYIHRGNYGLLSEQEMMAAGCSAAEAASLMRIKRWFAFGEIRQPSDLLDVRTLGGGWTEIQGGVRARRTGLNLFEFEFKGEAAGVDLNLAQGERYESPYPLGFHQIDRGYFSIIHSGEGDGWDINRPAMGSIISFQGRLFLVDAGPNLQTTLAALGIGVNELDGIFHTHSHDDHFSGLTTLMRSDHRLRYYATPLVRAAVTKKLCALLSMDDKRFSSFFDVVDLKEGAWNDIDGLEVMPMASPHPVETTIFMFRILWEGDYRTYAHFADIASFDVMAEMVTADPAKPGISEEFRQRQQDAYLTPATLKKVDIGGGLIHGQAEDYRNDRSEKIMLTHLARPLKPREKEIGSQAPLGTVDVLVSGFQEYPRRSASDYLRSYFTKVAPHRLQFLLNNEVTTFNPETLLIRQGRVVSTLYLILTGSIEMVNSRTGRTTRLAAGSLIGEMPALTGQPSTETYRTTSYVKALKLSASLFREFVQQNGLTEVITALAEKCAFLQDTWLFGEDISSPVQYTIAQVMTPIEIADGPFDPGENPADRFSLFVVREGTLHRLLDGRVVETLGPTDFFGEATALFGEANPSRIRALGPARLYRFAITTLSAIPVVRWKLFETWQKRKRLWYEGETGANRKTT